VGAATLLVGALIAYLLAPSRSVIAVVIAVMRKRLAAGETVARI